RGDRRYAFRADALLTHILGRRAEHGAAADVVCALRLEPLRGRRIVGRRTDQEGSRRGAPCHVDGQVARPEVYAVGVRGERDIETVVDEEQRIVARSDLAEHAGLLVELAG